MRTLMRAAAGAAMCLCGAISVAHADSWSDNTAYRSNGWSGSRQEMTARLDSGERQATTRRSRERTPQVTATDEDRPQRRARASAPDRSRVARGSIGSDSGSGGTTGVASYYWQPQRVASGGWFNPNAYTAAHKTLPFGTRVRVTNMGNGRSVEVTINDRGPYIAGRIIDLSKAAAQAISMTGQGIANVRMSVLGR